MTLGEKQRECRYCGQRFIPAFRHPNQISCGSKCKGWWASKREKHLAKRRSKYREDSNYRGEMIRRARTQKLQKAYGITLEQYERMLADQGGVCAICGSGPTSKSFLGYLKSLYIDHDHATGKVRKLLCTHCNSAIGYLRERPELAMKIIDYLREHADA